MRARVAVLAIALALGTAGCESAISNDETNDPLTSRDWIALSLSGKPVVKPGSVTMSFGEGRVSGRGGCNRYSGTADYANGTIKVGPLISTKMACMEDEIMQQESAYLTALQAATRYTIGGDGKLTIATGAGAIVYDPVPRQLRPDG
jgi:heat shock protein HslJ